MNERVIQFDIASTLKRTDAISEDLVVPLKQVVAEFRDRIADLLGPDKPYFYVVGIGPIVLVKFVDEKVAAVLSDAVKAVCQVYYDWFPVSSPVLVERGFRSRDTTPRVHAPSFSLT